MSEINNEDIVYFAKVREDAIIPTKRHSDAGYDIRASFDEDMMVIHSHEVRLIPTGIASTCSPKYYLNFKHERGSTAKIGMMTAAGVVDSSYRGEIFVALYNPTDKDIAITKETTEIVATEDYVLYPYTKSISQFTIDVVPQVNTQEISFEQLQQIPSERGDGKLGSSGK